MDKDSLRVIDFYKIIQRLEKLAITSGGKSRVMDLSPLSNVDEIRTALKETTTAKNFLQKEGDLPFSEFVDVEPLFERIRVLSLLTTYELLKISDVLSVFSEIKEIGASYSDVYPELYRYTSMLSRFDEIVKAIRRVVSADGKIVDDATPFLSIIRREIRTTYLRIQSILQEILYSRENEDVIQDKIITKRNDRYVIPIRQNSKPSFSYVVQGESGSKLTLYVEPMAVVELNNRLVELFSKEKEEEEKIILELEEKIRNKIDQVEKSLAIVYNLDFIFAKAKLSLELKAFEPIIEEEPVLELYEARNPFIPEDKVVPIDLEIGKGYKVLIITGPNTGGKTVTLKTAGLLSATALSGLHIPALSNSRIGKFENIYADIGDEQSVEQNLSTFSSHMSKIVNILKFSSDKDLVLLDELGAGTDPEEGAALGYAILKDLYDKGCITIVTTHHSKLKEFPYVYPNAMNASVGFDVETLSPIYKLYIGLPGESHAFVIAERLGLDKDVLEFAKNELPSDFVERSSIINKMHQENRAIEVERREIEQAKVEATKLREIYEAKLKELEEKKRLELRKAYDEAQKIIDDTKEKMAKILDNLDNYIKSQKEIQEMKKAIKDEEQSLEEKEEIFEEAKQVSKDEIKEGDIVFVSSFKATGLVLQVKREEGKLVVQMGAIRATLKTSDVQPVSKDQIVRNTEKTKFKELFDESLPIMLDLHGYTVEEAIEALDKYLDKAYLNGMPYVYIIHGKGTGALKEAVFEFLRKDKRVSRFELGTISEGGTGTTIVFFK